MKKSGDGRFALNKYCKTIHLQIHDVGGKQKTTVHILPVDSSSFDIPVIFFQSLSKVDTGNVRIHISIRAPYSFMVFIICNQITIILHDKNRCTHTFGDVRKRNPTGFPKTISQYFFFLSMLNHYKCIDLALFVCYFYSRNRAGTGGGLIGKYDSSESRR